MRTVADDAAGKSPSGPQQPFVEMPNGCKYATAFVLSLIAQVVARYPQLVAGREYTLRQICGDDYWLCLNEGEVINAGRCVLHLARAGVVPLIDTGRRNSANHHLYLVQ
jgi:hypothetical protein